jgi:hypothetical protein
MMSGLGHVFLERDKLCTPHLSHALIFLHLGAENINELAEPLCFVGSLSKVAFVSSGRLGEAISLGSPVTGFLPGFAELAFGNGEAVLKFGLRLLGVILAGFEEVEAHTALAVG